jgi:hypothetical protein
MNTTTKHTEVTMSNWISVKEALPKSINDEYYYSENVWVLCDNEVMVMRLVLIQDDDGDWAWLWANCYGNVFGDGKVDDDYEVTHWMPLEIPQNLGGQDENP